MKAEEARKLTENNRMHAYGAIMDDVRDAARRGKDSVQIDYEYGPGVIEKLKSEGYRVGTAGPGLWVRW
jgi:hypothetical protein